MRPESLQSLVAVWREEAASADSQGSEFDAPEAMGMGAYWAGRADALRDAAQQLAALAAKT